MKVTPQVDEERDVLVPERVDGGKGAERTRLLPQLRAAVS